MAPCRRLPASESEDRLDDATVPQALVSIRDTGCWNVGYRSATKLFFSPGFSEISWEFRGRGGGECFEMQTDALAITDQRNTIQVIPFRGGFFVPPPLDAPKLRSEDG